MLGMMLRVVSKDYSMHRSQMATKGQRLLDSLCRGYAERSTLFQTAESGLTGSSRVARKTAPWLSTNRSLLTTLKVFSYHYRPARLYVLENFLQR